MIEKNNPPFAPNLIESIRSIGYTFETALADVIDNSISAAANQIHINVLANGGDSKLMIIDDGCGMDNDILFSAMKYGSQNPNSTRNKDDMGRFGLGLKSASLSQCRRLTVISKVNNNMCGYVWDIDYIIEKGDWVLQELEEAEINDLISTTSFFNTHTGTMVIWEKFDRVESSSNSIDDVLKQLIVQSISHIELIYHRLLGNKVDIYFNGNRAIARDPFLEQHPATQTKRVQKIWIDGVAIVVQPYILPHISKLNKADLIKIGGKESLRSEQGFYIYRNKRLIIWGTWFRIGTKNELSKLARIMVDIPNNIDFLWDIDIKKSQASLPNKIKKSLHNAVLDACGTSEIVHEFKGKKKFNNNFIRTWDIVESRDDDGKTLNLKINTENPYFEGFINDLTHSQKRVFFSLINDIESNIPFDYIYSQMAKGKSVDDSDESIEIVIDKIMEKMNTYLELGMSRNDLIDYLLNDESFANNVDAVKKLTEMKRLGDS